VYFGIVAESRYESLSFLDWVLVLLSFGVHYWAYDNLMDQAAGANVSTKKTNSE
jgi:hypothetical protein